MSQMAQTTLGESTTVELALNLNDESHGLIPVSYTHLLAIDEAERRAIVKTLNALAILKRERPSRSVCHQCRDAHDLVTPMNGKTFLAKTDTGEITLTLHTRCVDAWAEENSFQALVPLRRTSSA